MNRTIAVLVCSLCMVFSVQSASVFGGASAKETAALEKERALLREYVQAARDSLQTDVASRYARKQAWVEQREADKEEVEKLREKQERTFNELSRLKEELLAREQVLQDERASTKQRQEEWAYVRTSFDDLLQKEADRVIESFPAEIERRREQLEQIRNTVKASGDAAVGWERFLDYRLSFLARSCTVSVGRQTLMNADGYPVALTLVRFGDVMAYGVDSAGVYYMLRQTGRLGAEKYTVERVMSGELNTYLGQAMPGWLTTGTVSGGVLMDVMQNEQSRLLIAGTKISWWVKTYEEMRAGGAVMIPMLLLPLWALVLVILKLVQFGTGRRRFNAQFGPLMSLLDKKDFAGAAQYAKSGKGVLAAVAAACIERRELPRSSGDHAARDLVYQEVHSYNHNLNTLAVIAGAAPLIGLLGTISGMITLFSAVTHYGTGDPKFLAGGISEALITAKTGLGIAIPVLFAHDYLRSMKDKLVAELEGKVTGLLNRIWLEV